MSHGFPAPFPEESPRPGMRVQRLTGDEPALLRVVRAVMAPGGGHPFHRHPHQEEFLYVTSGVVEQWIERDRRTMGPGDGCRIPPGVVHGSYNTSDRDVVMLAVRTPVLERDVVDTVDVSTQEPWASLRP